MKFGPSIRAVHFREAINPLGAARTPFCALGSLDPLPPRDSLTIESLLAWSQWQAGVGENLASFKRRIVADIRAETDDGHVVTLATHGGFFPLNGRVPPGLDPALIVPAMDATPAAA